MSWSVCATYSWWSVTHLAGHTVPSWHCWPCTWRDRKFASSKTVLSIDDIFQSASREAAILTSYPLPLSLSLSLNTPTFFVWGIDRLCAWVCPPPKSTTRHALFSCAYLANDIHTVLLRPELRLMGMCWTVITIKIASTPRSKRGRSLGIVFSDSRSGERRIVRGKSEYYHRFRSPREALIEGVQLCPSVRRFVCHVLYVLVCTCECEVMVYLP